MRHDPQPYSQQKTVSYHKAKVLEFVSSFSDAMKACLSADIAARRQSVPAIFEAALLLDSIILISPLETFPFAT